VSDFCIFCAIAAGTAPSYMVYQDDAAVAFLDLAPIRAGHTLVIPRRHVPDIMADDGGQAIVDVGPAMQAVGRLLIDAFAADGISVLQSNGAAAGQEVFHLHFHVVPRHDDDPAPIRVKRDPEATARVAATHALIVG
jgi:histidine triad (HIT) family protein